MRDSWGVGVGVGLTCDAGVGIRLTCGLVLVASAVGTPGVLV